MHIFETEEGILWDINHVYGNIYPAIAYISLFRIYTFFVCFPRVLLWLGKAQQT